MKSKPFFSLLLAVCLIAVFSAVIPALANQDPASIRAQAVKELNDGNYRDALNLFKKLLHEKVLDDEKLGNDFMQAVSCIQQLNVYPEFNELAEKAVETHPANWRLLEAVARSYVSMPKYGFVIDGEFQRAARRNSGQPKHSTERDRIRSIQLLLQAEPFAKEDDDRAAVGQLYMYLANSFLNHRGYQESWRLQVLIDLDTLPDYEPGYYYGRAVSSAPVNDEGSPLVYSAVENLEDAENDGERWRWALNQAIEMHTSSRHSAEWHFATFLHQQFGVQTMQYYFPAQRDTDAAEENRNGRFALDSLNDKETIAQLATGVKRFEMDDEFNFIKHFRRILNEAGHVYRESAASQIGSIYTNRRQFTRAADHWREMITKFNVPARHYFRTNLDQIVGNYGMFEHINGQSITDPKLGFRFRNATGVSFTAQPINVEKLLADVKAYLKSSPMRLDWNRVQLQNIGWRILNQDLAKYVRRDNDTKWHVDLEPRDGHYDKREIVDVPLENAGAYWVTGKVDDGNTANSLIWLYDTAIVKKALAGGNLYFVCDAETGQPIEEIKLDFFGYRQLNTKEGTYRITSTEFSTVTDGNGQAFPEASKMPTNHQWLITAKDNDGRFAYVGFQGVWFANRHDPIYNSTKVFCITDRPVYRPEQTAHFKLWLRRAQYDQDDDSQFANASCRIEIYDGKNEKVYSTTGKADEFGGIETNWDIPEDATLGVYRVHVHGIAGTGNRLQISGGNSFRVEEYKKPEFEVTVEAPSKPVELGEIITAKVNAKYYFGSPVSEATANIKVTRTSYHQNWYPDAHWDWCFGRGYWWYCYDYPWYPGWHEWVGCLRPYPIWAPYHDAAPEVVLDLETEVGPDGTISFDIDTSIAKELHGNTDHRYTVTAEVRDKSRRTIVGSGEVLATRKPFTVFTWLDRGYYNVGDTIQATFKAQTLDQRAVKGSGKLTLYRITYKDGKPVETTVRKWNIETNDLGDSAQKIAASKPGQYRLSLTLEDEHDHEVEGGYIFTVRGREFDGRDYQFNDLELIPDKREYKAGDKVKLQINSNRRGATVLLFVRPTNGVYFRPKIIRLKGKSTVEEILVVKKDMPNFFVEATTVFDGRVISQTKEVVVPPEKRVLNVQVIPSAEEYLPGEDATVRLHVTDINGDNFEGSTVVSVYDKSVEYISGGSNVPDIKEFFWKWRRNHRPGHQTNLGRPGYNMYKNGTTGMTMLGVFGHTVADDYSGANDAKYKTANAPGLARRSMSRQSSYILQDTAEMASPAQGQALGGGLGGGGRFAAKGQIAMETASADQAMSPLDGRGRQSGQQGVPLVQPNVRSNFADTALWAGSVITDVNGIAEVSLKMPENLTTWKVNVWALGHGTKVGSGSAEVVTRKNLIVRLQAPRFFVQKDEVVLSANVHNYLDTEKQVQVTLGLEGGELSSFNDLTQNVVIPANGEQRVDWRVKVNHEGEAIVRMSALTDEESDAMEMTFPVFVHGMLKTESWAGTIRPDKNSSLVQINVPAERRPEQSLLEVRYSPTLAGAMVDALPYLADFPHGCTEQTLNRFIPAVITQKILLDMDLNLEQIRDKRTNLNAQEIGDGNDRARQWHRWQKNPVFSVDELDRMVAAGIQRLAGQQNSDGGWGWFSSYDRPSWVHTTATVVHGLQIAKRNGINLKPEMLERGLTWLKRYQATEVEKIKRAEAKQKPYKLYADNMDALVYRILTEADHENDDMRGFLYRDRNRLTVYGKVLFALGLHSVQQEEQLNMLIRNIEQFLIQDEENETAYLDVGDNALWWYWYGDEIEANAGYLQLISRVKPQSVQASRIVKFLLNNRKHATYWKSTRDTAYCIESFGEYLKATNELRPDMVVEVWVDGDKLKEVEITGDNLFSFDNAFFMAGDELTDGSHEVELRRRGKGAVYFNAYLTNFTLEDHIAQAGLEVKVHRRYYKLIPENKDGDVPNSKGQAIKQRIESYKREVLSNLDELTSGDLVEVELIVESKNDYEYVLLEDKKPAGFEPTQLISGYDYSRLPVYREMRDESVNFFLRRLPLGKHSFSYRMRAETPGKFSALPTYVHAMYAPELRGNSDEIKLNVVDE